MKKFCNVLCAGLVTLLMQYSMGHAAEKVAPQNTPQNPAIQTKVTENTDSSKAIIHDPLAGADEKILKEFYLIKGRTYKKVTSCLTSLNPAITGLDASKTPYYLRIDKELTDKFFRHVRAYDKMRKTQIGEYYVAKDLSSVWRLDGDHPGMIAGSAKKVMKKTRLFVYPPYLQIGETGVVRLETPGNVPYHLTVKSLDEGILHIDENNRMIPRKLGKTNVLVEAEIGDTKDTGTARVQVVTKEKLEQLAYHAYVRQLYYNRMLADFYWHDWWDEPFYYSHYRYRRPPRPRGGHKPPPKHR
jgi:hypothetical protein